MLVNVVFQELCPDLKYRIHVKGKNKEMPGAILRHTSSNKTGL